MQLKSLITATAVALLAAAPAFSQGHRINGTGHGQGAIAGHGAASASGHVFENAIACDFGDADFTTFGGYSRFVNSHGIVWTGGFAQQEEGDSNALTGISVRPSNPIAFKNWSMDVSTNDDFDAYAITVFQVPGGFASFYNSTGNGVGGSQVPNFSSTTLNNGFVRWKFVGVPTAANECGTGSSIDMTGAKLAAVFFIQYATFRNSETDIVSNVSVNGSSAIPATDHSYIYDCSPDDSCNDAPSAP